MLSWLRSEEQITEVIGVNFLISIFCLAVWLGPHDFAHTARAGDTTLEAGRFLIFH